MPVLDVTELETFSQILNLKASILNQFPYLFSMITDMKSAWWPGRTFHLFVVLLVGWQCNMPADDATTFPGRPITYIVPWSPGGMTDISSRALAAVLQKHLGVAVNVVNRTGGGGVVGHLALSQAAPDGYTIGAMTVEITMMHYLGMTDLTANNFTPLSLVIDNAAALTVKADAPYQTFADLLEALREHPGDLQASGTARGGIWDLARIGFLQEAGMDESAMPWVPSQGAAPALQELIAGGIEVVVASLSEVDGLRRAGEVRPLVVMSDERLPSFPDVPTLKENGINWVSSGWVTVSAPAHLPTTIKEKLDAAIKASLTDAEFTQALAAAGSNVRMLQGDALVQFITTADLQHGETMAKAGLKAKQ